MMGSSKGGGGNPGAFTGGSLAAPPIGGGPVQTGAPPSYANFLPGGGMMATPESVAAAYAAQPVPAQVPVTAAQPMPDMNVLRAMLTQMMQRQRPRPIPYVGGRGGERGSGGYGGAGYGGRGGSSSARGGGFGGF
jgi:hypothetical protein